MLPDRWYPSYTENFYNQVNTEVREQKQKIIFEFTDDALEEYNCSLQDLLDGKYGILSQGLKTQCHKMIKEDKY